MFRSIRVRLAAWYTSVFALTFILSAWTIYEYVGHTLSNQLDESVMNELQWAAIRYEKHLLRHEDAGAVRDDVFEHASIRAMKVYAEIWDSLGSLFYHSPNLGDDTLARLVAAPDRNSLTFTTIADFRNHGIRLSIQKNSHTTIFLAMPVEGITTSLSQLVTIFMWLGPAVILIAAGGGMFLAKKSFSQINRVIETAQRITADRLYDRIPERDTRDEIGKIISTFNDMISRLDVSFTHMKQFSADASHELRTPLTVIRTQLESALDSKVGLMEMKKIIAHCLDETLRMSAIIENLLLLAKADSGQEPLLREPVDLKKLLCDVCDEIVIIASQRNITVVLKPPDEALILGDRQRLRQMLLNMIDNALKYSHSSGNITMGLMREDGIAKITIADTGIGIPSHEIPRIFDRFYRVDRARSRELGGAGLGLSIVHWIVHAHGGSITVQSESGRGSEFIVALPLVQEG